MLKYIFKCKKNNSIYGYDKDSSYYGLKNSKGELIRREWVDYTDIVDPEDIDTVNKYSIYNRGNTSFDNLYLSSSWKGFVNKDVDRWFNSIGLPVWYFNK